MTELFIVGMIVLVCLVIGLPLVVSSEREMRRSLEKSQAAHAALDAAIDAARKVEDEPFEGRYRILPIVGGYRIERYGARLSWRGHPYKGYAAVAEVQGSIEDARATVEHLSQPVEVIR